MPRLWERDMWDWFRAQVLYIHPAYFDEVVYTLIEVDANFGYTRSFDDKPAMFLILTDAKGGQDWAHWPPGWVEIPSDFLRSQKRSYPWVHETPDGDLILIEHPAT